MEESFLRKTFKHFAEVLNLIKKEVNKLAIEVLVLNQSKVCPKK